MTVECSLSANGIIINGHEFRPVVPPGNRFVVILDRGWIYAGDLTEGNGRIHLSRVVWVFRWESIGLDGVIANPKDSRAVLRPIEHEIDLPADAEIYRISVSGNWGL